MARLLILGGTSEAADLAHRVATLGGLEVTTSLAGRTRTPRPLPGNVRVGGFGGADGLAAYLKDHAVDLVVDATHPFAEVISANAAAACRSVEVSRLALVRSPWQPVAGDDWIGIGRLRDAPARLQDTGIRAFLAVGGKALDRFQVCRNAWFLVRMVDLPDQPLPLANAVLIAGRGPFDVESELAVLRRYRINRVVAKNSGGSAGYAKIAAARALGIPVIMVRRPASPEGPVAADATAAMAWIRERTSG